MRCQYCNAPATVHITQIVQHAKAELHLCEQCAAKQHLVSSTSLDINVPNVLQLLLGLPAATGAAGLLCPHCGLKYEQFRRRGRLGCPHDYDAFAQPMSDLLERIHRSVQHRGKVPRRLTQPETESIAQLRQQLLEAVEAERYEDAANLRDLIRQREASDEPR